ncbi:MAG: hypothetical protein O3B01_25660 [Planctomycetota bacterium]|nr:hypothetical protein [Planctomycetota bacterium]MDA1141966.1 hypothetical protein [Planctomycetota bacterium]
MSIGAAINTVLNSIPQMPVATSPTAPPVKAQTPPPVETTTPASEDASTDVVEISSEGEAAIVADQSVVSVAVERLIFPYPFPGSEIDALLNNLRQRENLEYQMFRLQDDAITDRKVGILAADGTSPEDLRKQANELSKKNKHDEANELNQLSWLMDGRGIPEDDPATSRNELEEAGKLLIQRADDKQVVASLIGNKVQVLKEDFDELVENFDVNDNDDFSPPFFLAATAEQAV